MRPKRRPCTKCGGERDGSGKSSWCKKCKARHQKKWRKANPDLHRERQRLYRSRHPEVHREAYKRWKARHPGRGAELSRNWKKRHGFRRRFLSAVEGARKRRIEFSITEDQYALAVASGACHYCGGDLPICGGGIDRKDNSAGYTADNIVPCCARCNRMKGCDLTYDEMVLIWDRRRKLGLI